MNLDMPHVNDANPEDLHNEKDRPLHFAGDGLCMILFQENLQFFEEKSLQIFGKLIGHTHTANATMRK